MILDFAKWGLTPLIFWGAAWAADLHPPGIRLGDVATPQSYDLRLSVDPSQPVFEGEVRIDLLVNRDTDVLWLNAQDLDIESAAFTQGEMTIPVKIHRAGEDLVGFEATGEKFVFGSTTAVIRYRGKLVENDVRGLFRTREGGDWYVVSQFEALDARRAIPSFDEPAWKTPWSVTVDTPAADRVVSNARETSVEDVPGRSGWKRHHFARTQPLPSYLVAVAVGPFDIVDGGSAGTRPTPLRFVVPKGRADEARFAQSATPRIVALLEAYFDGPFPFAKLDSVAIPGSVHFGAMENAGMITCDRGVLLARPQDESLVFRRGYASVGAHEIAHQWVGDLVTLAWWDDAWLNEAFATWLARKTSRAYEPEWESGWRHGAVRRTGLAADRLATARQVHNPVRDRNDVDGAFDEITYSKGAEVLSMFESWLGEETFRKGVRDYVRAHAGGNATSEDFFRAVGEAGGRGDRAVAALRTFVDQPGLPLVDVSLACDRGSPTLKVSQRRFAGLGQPAGTQKWITPACFRYRAGGKTAKQCAEITGESAIPLATSSCPEWLVGNADGAGHWVARYDGAMLRNLEARVVDLPENEAVAFAGDAALLVNSGLMSRDAGLRLANAFLRHPAIGVRHGGIAFLASQRDEWLNAAQRQARHTLLVSYVWPMTRSLGWLDRPNDSAGTQELRSAVMTYAARVQGGELLRGPARDFALRWIDDRASIPASNVPAVLETAARFADVATYERFSDALASTQQPHERTLLLSALAAVRDPVLRNRTLDLALRDPNAGGLPPSEAQRLLEKTLHDDANRVPAFAFVRDHWDAWVAKLPPDSPSRLIDPLGQLCTKRDRQEFVAFFQPKVDAMRGAPREYAQALESIDVCIAAASAPGEPAPAVKASAKKRSRAAARKRR